MSGQYQEIDLEGPGPKKTAAEAEAELEIVEQEVEAEPEPQAEKPAPKAGAEGEDEAEEGEPKQGRLSRSQRLKLQRDTFAKQLAETKAELEAERQARTKLQTQNDEAATAGYDFYIQTLEDSMKMLRGEFDAAFDQGDRDKLFGVQQRMAELAAEKKAAERDKAQRPTKAAAGGEGQKPQTQQTTETQASPQSQPSSQGGKPNPLAVEWADRHKGWFGKNQVMTMAARVIDAQMASEGFDPNEPEYFDELDKRLKEEFPHRMTGDVKKTQAQASPTVQNRAATLAPGTKMRVVITPQDRDMARRLNISIEEYAKQKARRDAAANSVSGYTEIV